MDIQTLKNNLLEAYSAENLNKIAVVLLNFYKNQQFGSLQKIADIIGDYFVFCDFCSGFGLLDFRTTT